MERKYVVSIIVSLIIGLIIGYPIGYFTSGGTAGGPAGGVREYTIGITFALSGPVSSVCIQWEPAAKVAIDDLNNLTKSMGLNLVFKPYILDDGGSPEGALKNVQTFYSQGIHVVIGPALSSQVKAVKAYSDSYKVLIIAPCSNSPALAIPGDYIFRTQPSALREAKALASLAIQEGIKKVVAFHINDEFCNAFATSLTGFLRDQGGEVVYDLAYQPGQADYGADVASLASWVGRLGPDAIFYCGYDTDGANVLSHAADIDALKNVRWITVEGFYGASEVLTEKIVNFANKTRLLGLRPVPIANPLYDEFVEKLKKYGGTPTLCSENVYDAVMIAGLAIIRTGGSTDTDTIRSALVEVAKTYYGAGGWGMFDENGDRLQASFRIWTLGSVGGVYQYVDVGSISDSSIVFTQQQG